ncbi:MAG: hypothetical protein ABI723_11745 [Bacteroidia bacterium]
MKKKTIKVEIQNKHLDALEDLLYCELNEKQTEAAKKHVKKLWQSLVEAYDKQKEK